MLKVVVTTYGVYLSPNRNVTPVTPWYHATAASSSCCSHTRDTPVTPPVAIGVIGGSDASQFCLPSGVGGLGPPVNPSTIYSDRMRTGVFLFGGVEMDDAGAGPPAPTDRRYDAKAVWAATERILDTGVLCDQLGFDSFWLTEHHFQHEGYEVVPNGLMTGAILAERTEQIRIGTMFNIVGQWHPLRLAEDFATLHNISKGRGILGIGRGTVPREAEALGTKIGSFDNPDQAAADSLNRKQFAEAVEVMRLALDHDSFSFHGEVFDFPPPGIPDRGGFVETLSLLPRPLYPYEMWQAITSPPTLETVPRSGWGGVFWLKHHTFVKQFWDRFAEIYEAGARPGVGAGRETHPRGQHLRRRQLRGSGGVGPTRARRVLEVPRPLRLEPGLHGARRWAR